MSHLVSSSAPIASAHVVRSYSGFGILGANISTTGDSGGSPVLNDGVLDGSEYYWRVETSPSAGILTTYPDLTFTFESAPDGSYSWVYRLYQDNVSQGTATVYQIVGAPVVQVSATTSGAVFSGAAVLGIPTADVRITSATAGAVFSGQTSSALHIQISATTAGTIFSGVAYIAGSPVSVSISTVTAGATFSGGVLVSGGVSGSLSDYDIGRIVSAVLAALNATTIPVDLQKQNGVEIVGDGSVDNKFRSVLYVG